MEFSRNGELNVATFISSGVEGHFHIQWCRVATFTSSGCRVDTTCR
jgi:hypothetical protein